MRISNKIIDYVPCLFMPSQRNRTNKLILFFHGNGEDLGTSYAMLDRIRLDVQINVLAVEYPTYGVYDDPEGASEEKILRDAEIVY